MSFWYYEGRYVVWRGRESRLLPFRFALVDSMMYVFLWRDLFAVEHRWLRRVTSFSRCRNWTVRKDQDVLAVQDVLVLVFRTIPGKLYVWKSQEIRISEIFKPPTGMPRSKSQRLIIFSILMFDVSLNWRSWPVSAWFYGLRKLYPQYTQ